MLTDKDICRGMIVRCMPFPFHSTLAEITMIEGCILCKCNHYRARMIDSPYNVGTLCAKHMRKVNTFNENKTNG